MSDEKDRLIPGEDEFSLDEILSEVSSWDSENPAAPIKEETKTPVEADLAPAPATAPPPAQPAPQQQEEVKEQAAPISPPTQEEAPSKEEEAAPPPAPKEEPAAPVPEGEGEPAPKQGPPDAAEEPPSSNLIPFYPPQEAETVRDLLLLYSKRFQVWQRLKRDQLSMLKRRAKQKPKVKVKGERFRLRLPRIPDLPPPPDLGAKELAGVYSKGLSLLRLRCAGVLACAALLFLLAFLYRTTAIPTPAFCKDWAVMSWTSFGLFLLAALLGYRVYSDGVLALLKGRPRMETVGTLASFVVLVDGLSLAFFSLRPQSLPLYAPAALVLGFQLWGIYWKQQALRLTCRTAAVAAEPDLMTMEPSQWNGKAVYRRRSGAPVGFGSQIQQEDGAERLFRVYVPVLLVLALILSLVATVFHKQPNLFIWALSASLIGASTLSGCLCFSLPFRGLSLRLSKLGVALAGWPGAEKAKAGSGLLVEDTDLFPPGFIEIKSYRLFGGFSPEKVLSVTASLIRASGSGLDDLFFNLIRTEVGTYVTVTELEVQNEGISAHVWGENVLVGTLSYLERHGVEIPIGVRVKTGVFCAISDTFAGQFILDYNMHKSFSPSMDAVLSNRITPVLIALDFNLVPAILKRVYPFPWEKMAFPDVSQRAKLLKSPIPREAALLAVLCLEGMTPLATAAAGAQRLQAAVRVCAGFTCVAGTVGVLLAAFLATAGALASLSAVSLFLFLLFWFLPTLLIAGWVNQF